MTYFLSPRQTGINETYTRFATKYIAKKKVFSRLDHFPVDLWRQMGKLNLIGLGLPRRYGGQGGKWIDLTVASEALVQGGGNLGFPMAWIIHEIVSRFFYLGFGNAKQKKMYLPVLASGSQIACFAVSEPKIGAHPKYLKTTADLSGTTYSLNGRKWYLTNGPIADLFVTVAITGREEGRKQFSAFIVENGLPGLSIETMQIKNLYPAQHGGIRLKECSIDSSQLLGETGRAYEDMVLPFRGIEDTLILGGMIGAMQYLIIETIKMIKKEKVAVDDSMVLEIGKMQCGIHAARVLAYEAAVILDQSEQNDSFQSLLYKGKDICCRFYESLAGLIAEFKKPIPKRLAQLLKDFKFTLSISERATQMKIQKLGMTLINR